MTITRLILLMTLALHLAAAGARASSGQDVDRRKAAQVQSAFLYNFTKFVEWPADAFESDDAPLVLGVLGDSFVLDALARAVEGKHAGSRPIEVRRLDAEGESLPPADRLGACHLVFVGDAFEERRADLLAILRDKPVLTVADFPGFARAGGMIQFVLEKGKYSFLINPEEARKVALRISAKLLSLATIVETEASDE